MKGPVWREGSSGHPNPTKTTWVRKVNPEVESVVLALLGQFAMIESFGFPNGQAWGKQPWYYVHLYRVYRQAEVEHGANS